MVLPASRVHRAMNCARRASSRSAARSSSAARSATGRNLIDFLAEHRPPGADERYGNGHAQATGGALRIADWNAFVADLGLPDQQVDA